jgi:hypothetical protein
MVTLLWKCCAKLVEYCIPRGERGGISKALNHFAVAIEKLALNSGDAECSQRGNAVRRHPVEHLILNDQAAAPTSKGRWRLLVNLHVAAQAAQSDASGQPGNRTADNDYFR